jgi:phosphoglucomutase
MTLSDALDEIYEKYGYYEETVKAYTLEGKEGMEKIASCMKQLRADRPEAFAGIAVSASEDYLARECISADGSTTPIALPKSDVLRWLLADDSWIVVRPSGTEPKLKLYIGACAKTQDDVAATLKLLMQDVNSLLSGHLSIPVE